MLGCVKSLLLLLPSLPICWGADLSIRDLISPADINGWMLQGCYVDVGRTLQQSVLVDTYMTSELCVAHCATEGYSFAGTEWYTECYCGDVLAVGAVEVDASECNTPCSGDANQACGGSGRLVVYHNDDIQGPHENPGPNGWISMGCYTGGITGRTLTTAAVSVPGSQMTIELCTNACSSLGFILAGVEYGSECYCGNAISNGGERATGECEMPCNGNHDEFCGGPNRLNLYNYMNIYNPTATTLAPSMSTPTPTPVASSQPAIVGSFGWYACMTEGTGVRALSAATFSSGNMTLESCAAFCTEYLFFGTEYASECYCGNVLNAGSVLAADGQCNMVCSGNPETLCGAGNRLSVYRSVNGPVPEPPPTPVSTTTVPGPTATGFPLDWSNRGCWVDGAHGRILPYQAQDDPTMTLESCAALCFGLGFNISGAEYFQQCFCGNYITNGGELAADQESCNTPCVGNPSQMCGGPSRMTIYSASDPSIMDPPGPQISGLPTGWVYKGCVTDNVDDKRTFPWQLVFPGRLTPSECLDRCAKFKYAAAGLEYGEECYCGDPANIVTTGATYHPAEECGVPCAGDGRFICGGGSRLSTYFWEGDEPLYQWEFAQGPEDSGSYEFLIGGVCIPLMTMESITGKVTFLEKGGTGPANSTGAYELDLSIADDFALAWREMHVKSDIFCSGGIVLPDKAGRQLTVGGWAGKDTEGVRLYWPDGTPGVNGTNDWQENVNALALQDGRWYPSVMIMANGSVLVIGGEKGSNDAAVPTLELLPATGTPPLFMDWLERTDPNNLYPFVFVLPGGGIFVAYWNEARILNEVTFATDRLLPNMPGAVNDDLGGRTYPLEGTAVLLPQHAPYTDPLTVLICGGSTMGPATALDNCVSIEPEAAEPTWTIERMPSRRVVSCMAPLPDGTYVVINGAQHGVAGFGLAERPNLNALLYDPKRPAGHRFTIAANTTIARMYHSEAITLLDGRVLISGSDPQDAVNPQEYRVEVYNPPYLLRGLPRPTFSLENRDWGYGENVAFHLGAAAKNGAIEVSLLGAVSSTHGNSMGARTIFPEISCEGTACVVVAPPDSHVSPPGWYQFFVLDGGIPGVGVYVRIGGDPAGLGNWPEGQDFSRPGV